MRKYLAIFATFAMVFVLSSSAVFAQKAEDKPSINDRVFKEIVTLPNYGLFDSIKFEINGSTVILSGKLYNAFNKKTAENRVKKIDGVETVINNIEILPPSSFDDRIRRNTVWSFTNTGGIYRYLIGPNPSVRIIVENGHLTLEGFVANKGDIRLMNILARGVPGAFSVTNNLEVDVPLK